MANLVSGAAQIFSKKQDKNPNIFVGGIMPSLSRADVLNYLATFDIVDFFEMPVDSATKEWKGFAKARLRSQHGVDMILGQRNHVVKGVPLAINPWRDQEEYLASKDSLNRRKLFVRFKPVLDERSLTAYFLQFGKISRIDCKRNLTTRKQRNFAYVVFEREEDAHNASVNGSISTKGLKIECELTMPKFLMRKIGKTGQEAINIASNPGFMLKVNKKGDSRQPQSSKSDQKNKISPKTPNKSIGLTDGNHATGTAAGSAKYERLPRNTQVHATGSFQNPASIRTGDFDKFTNFDYASPETIGLRSNICREFYLASIVKQSMTTLVNHHRKPTSRRYPAEARSSVSANHISAVNLFFRLNN